MEVLKGVRKTEEPSIVTRWGKPIAQIQPKKQAFGCMKGTSDIVGDLLKPLPDLGWDALK